MSGRNGEISVSKYPGDKGVLYRTPQGIVYTSTDKGVIALGHDVNDTEIISPFDSVNMKALVDKDVEIDDSLARKSRSTGGLSAHCFKSVNGTVIHVIYVPPSLIHIFPPIIYQPISLVKRVFDYIVKSPNRMWFNLEKLPPKMKNHINFCVELNGKREELSVAERNYTTSIGKLETSYHVRKIGMQDNHRQRLLTLNNTFSVRIEGLESEHFVAVKELKEASADVDLKIVTEIRKLELSISKYSQN